MVGKGGVIGIHQLICLKNAFNYAQKAIFNEAITFSSAQRFDKRFLYHKTTSGFGYSME
jgi:hypothetical protein